MKNLILFCLLISSPVFADEDPTLLPERYAQLGLEPLEQVFDFEFTRFRDGDRQSLVLKTRGGEIYLLVFDRPISPRNKAVRIKDRHLRVGFTRVWVTDRDLTLSRRLEATYQIENKEQENEILKFLRAND